MSAVLRPSSPFPFAPLTDDLATDREAFAAGQIAAHVLGDREWFVPRGDGGDKVAQDVLQQYVDYRASTDVRCGYVRDGGDS